MGGVAIEFRVYCSHLQNCDVNSLPTTKLHRKAYGDLKKSVFMHTNHMILPTEPSIKTLFVISINIS